MQEFLSRSEKRLTKLYAAAESGKMSIENEILYSSEISKYIKQGFAVLYHSSSFKNLYTSELSWSHVFRDIDIPKEIYDYITGVTGTYPKSQIKTFAQKLYVISARATYNQK